MTNDNLKKIAKLISDSEERIVTEFENFINGVILPQLEDKADKADVKRLDSKVDSIERKIDRLLDQSVVQEKRITRIESIPIIAHELKIRRD